VAFGGVPPLEARRRRDANLHEVLSQRHPVRRQQRADARREACDTAAAERTHATHLRLTLTLASAIPSTGATQKDVVAYNKQQVAKAAAKAKAKAEKQDVIEDIEQQHLAMMMNWTNFADSQRCRFSTKASTSLHRALRNALGIELEAVERGQCKALGTFHDARLHGAHEAEVQKGQSPVRSVQHVTFMRVGVHEARADQLRHGRLHRHLHHRLLHTSSPRSTAHALQLTPADDHPVVSFAGLSPHTSTVFVSEANGLFPPQRVCSLFSRLRPAARSKHTV
jgi:hypothetical protein